MRCLEIYIGIWSCDIFGKFREKVLWHLVCFAICNIASNIFMVIVLNVSHQILKHHHNHPGHSGEWISFPFIWTVRIFHNGHIIQDLDLLILRGINYFSVYLNGCPQLGEFAKARWNQVQQHLVKASSKLVVNDISWEAYHYYYSGPRFRNFCFSYFYILLVFLFLRCLYDEIWLKLWIYIYKLLVKQD